MCACVFGGGGCISQNRQKIMISGILSNERDCIVVIDFCYFLWQSTSYFAYFPFGLGRS